MSIAIRWLVSAAGRLNPEFLPANGARLGLLGREAWYADRELRYPGGYSLPVRMVVLRCAEGELTLYSPVELDESTREALAGLGPVSTIIVPNRFHTLSVEQAMDVYPQATLLLPQANGNLAERFPHRSRVVGELEHLNPGTEIMPVRLREGLDELVIYHDPSECLILGDLLFNLRQVSSVPGRWFERLNGIGQQPGQSRLQKLLLLKDMPSLRRFYHWALSRPFSQISMAHGHLITLDAREVFYQKFHFAGR